jgi:hypothetical protein
VSSERTAAQHAQTLNQLHTRLEKHAVERGHTRSGHKRVERRGAENVSLSMPERDERTRVRLR